MEDRSYFRWMLVLTAFLGTALGFGSFVAIIFGLFLKPVASAFSWTRTEVSIALSICTVSIILLAPLAGNIIDRVGVRRVIIPCLAVLGLSIILLSFLPDSLFIFYFLHFIIAVSGAGSSFVSYTKVLANWFDKNRGLVLGLTMSGMGIAGIILPPSIEWFISEFGWRIGYMAFGSSILLIPLPLVIIFLRDNPKKRGDMVKSYSEFDDKKNLGGSHTNVHFSFSETARQLDFSLLCLAFLLLGAATIGISAHTMSMLTDSGLDAQLAARIIAIASISNVVSRVLCGHLLDRFCCGIVSFIFIGCMSLGALSLAYFSGYWFILSLILIGIGAGSEADVMSYFVSRRYGLAGYGRVLGAVYALFCLGAGIGAMTMGFLYDVLGDYSKGFIVLGIFTAVGATISLYLGRRLSRQTFLKTVAISS